MAVLQTGSLLSFSITSLVQLTRMGSLAGFLDNNKSLLGYAAGFGLAWHFRFPFGPGVDFCGRLICRLPFGKIGKMMVSNGSLEPFITDIWPDLPERVC